MAQTISITIKGRVQGVYFRQTAKELATRLGLTGEVKNLATGDVEIIAYGNEDQLNQLITWCHKGPDRAMVHHVKVEKRSAQEFPAFTVIR